MEYICPHCEAHISYLSYTMNGYEYGSYGIESEDYVSDGMECDGDTNYTCPECDEDICHPNDLETVDDDNDEDDEDEEEKEIDIAPIRIPDEPNKMLSDFKVPWNTGKKCAECTKCGQVVEFDNNEEEIECPICNTIIKKD